MGMQFLGFSDKIGNQKRAFVRKVDEMSKQRFGLEGEIPKVLKRKTQSKSHFHLPSFITTQ
jgi:hypothetical protein